MFRQGAPYRAGAGVFRRGDDLPGRRVRVPGVSVGGALVGWPAILLSVKSYVPGAWLMFRVRGVVRGTPAN